mgnify:CR=1 FL=1
MKQNYYSKRLISQGRLLCFVAILLFLNACANESSAPSTPASGEADTLVEDILVSTTLDRSDAKVLDGSVISGTSYILMAETKGLSQTTFYIDKETGGPSQEPYSTVKYNGLETSIAADYLDTEIFEDGVHVLTALIQYADGGYKEVNSTFLVDNEGELADQLLVSSSSSRSGATLLGSQPLTGDNYIFVVPREKTRQISFYLNDTGRSGRPKQIERIVQYDFAGTADNGSAQAFDTRKLKDGRHTISAVIKMHTGRSKVVSKSFSVANGSTTSPQPPDPRPSPSNFPLNLMGKAPEQKSASLSVNKPSSAGTAAIILKTYDADRYGEGALYINGNGPVRLFDKQASSNFHDRYTNLTYRTPASWWRNGKNELLFKHIYGEGFKIDTVEVHFSSGGTNPAPEPTSPAPAPSPSPGPDATKLGLRGNPNFSPGSLSAEERKWYNYLWLAIDNSSEPDPVELAKSGDLFAYRGLLQAYVSNLLAAFRVTGDLKLLDKVDEFAQFMQSTLRDSDGDGYLNWVDKWSSSSYRGTDKQMAFDLKAHALVAEIAWALHNNRDLRSPSGINYGAHADYWKNYLTRHFEAKWRKRNGKPSGFPFAEHTTLHTYHSFMKWHHYMGKLTGSRAYTQEAERMANQLWRNEFKDIGSKNGTALVWARGVISEGSSVKYLMPEVYARFVVQEAVDLHFEGFSYYKSNTNMQKFANTFTGFMIDVGSYDSFARDIGGGRSRGGLAASPSSWPRMNQPRFAMRSWALLASWDRTGEITRVAEKVFDKTEYMEYGRPPRRAFIPAAMLVKEKLR